MSNHDTNLGAHYEHADVESYIKQQWTETEAYNTAKAANSDEDPFYFVDGPPFTSGRMHCGTAWGKILKDVLLRYHRMDGKNVVARPGYDTHGLPIEVKVEQEHDFETKQEIEEYGVEKFVEECREYAASQRAVMDNEFTDMGVWMDWDDVYETMSVDYMRTVWSAFSRLYDDGMVSRGEEVLNTCPRCETALSDAELSYADRTVEAAYVGFPLIDEDSWLLTWTTTPWTVVGNQFVAVDEDAEYARVKMPDKHVYVAAETVEQAMESVGLGTTEYTVLDTVSGTDLVGKTYQQPLRNRVDTLPSETGVVAHADYVTTDKTGLVHSAPGFGHEDYERGTELGLAPFSPVKPNGEFSDTVSAFAGQYVHDTGSTAVMEALQDRGSLLGTEQYTHEYPQCPRCDTQVVYRAMEQWFMTVTEIKEDLLGSLEQTEWYPPDARDTRFTNTIETAPDWNVSRQRYWGTPIPVWVCESCGEDTVVSTPAELQQRSQLEHPPEDLHRPSVDDVTVTCEHCGSDAHRIEDVLDVWFDSSVASWASQHTNLEADVSPEPWPADLVVEGYDQTRGWFLMQLYMGVALADEPPYEEVLMHGFGLLDNKPMSKSRGHVLRPPAVIDEHGRDALRAYLLSHEQQEQDVNMSSDTSGVADMRQKFDVVWNVYRFALMYMTEDEFTVTAERQCEHKQDIDRWILSRLSSVTETATQAFEDREPNVALNEVLSFLLDDLSRYYVKTIRDRVWTVEMTESKRAAYDTLGTVLHASTRLLAPFAPHLAEYLYQSLPADTQSTVHAESWPDTAGLPRDSALVDTVSTIRATEQAVASCRHYADRKQRWPVTAVHVETTDESVRQSIQQQCEFVKTRINADTIDVVETYEQRKTVAVPDMSVLGPRFGSDAQPVAEKVRGTPVDQLPVTVTVDQTTCTVTDEMVTETEQLPDNIVSETTGFGRVYVDLSLTSKQEKRGLARDVVRRIQEMRDEMELDMHDTVVANIDTDDDRLSAAISENRPYISEETRITRFAQSADATQKTWTIEQSDVTISLAE